MRRALLGTVLAALLAQGAAGRPAPAPAGPAGPRDPAMGQGDPRIRTTPYDPTRMLRAYSTDHVPLTFLFDAGEQVILEAGLLVYDDPAKAEKFGPHVWYERHSLNVMILQPLGDVPVSTLFVQTRAADGSIRHYNYELHTRVGDITDLSNPNAVKDTYTEVDYVGYPHIPTPEETARAEARRDAAAERRAHARLAQAVYAAPRNRNYWKRGVGCAALAPTGISDDGVVTTLLFPPHAVLPIIRAFNQDNTETTLTTVDADTVDGTLVTLPQTYREIRLHRSHLICAEQNRGYQTAGRQPGGGTGTISPDVVREAR